jgi:hypothetical protein
MKFYSILLQPDGRIDSRREMDSARLISNRSSRRLVRQFSEHFRECRSDRRLLIPAFEAPFRAAGQDGLMNWAQAEPMSAMASLFVGWKSSLLSLLLCGFVPKIDQLVIKLARKTLASFFEAQGLDPGPGLAEIPERPAVVNIPCHPATAPHAVFRLTSLSCCLGFAFFQHSEICFETAKIDWRCFRGRNGRKIYKQLNVLHKFISEIGTEWPS